MDLGIESTEYGVCRQGLGPGPRCTKKHMGKIQLMSGDERDTEEVMGGSEAGAGSVARKRSRTGSHSGAHAGPALTEDP